MSSMKHNKWTTSCTQNEAESTRETLIWLESVTEKETGNAQTGACVDVLPRCWCAICEQYQSSCAPKLARKCEIEHWLPFGADGRFLGREGGRCAVTWLPNFLGWVADHIFLPMVLRCARLARESSAMTIYLCINFFIEVDQLIIVP